MKDLNLIHAIVEKIGGQENVVYVTNCMTRLRIKLKDESLIDLTGLKSLEGVLGLVNDETLQIVVGPGKARKLCDLIVEEYGFAREKLVLENWEENKKIVKGKQNPLKQGLRTIGEIFIPMIPAIIAAGLFSGFGGLITNLQSTGSLNPDSTTWNLIELIFQLLGNSFLTYFVIFTGINAAKQFGATHALGGMVGAITILPQIDAISQMFGLYNVDNPLNSLLRTGKGGVIGVIIGVYLLAKIEKWIRKRVPDTLDLIATPVITLLLVVILLVFIIMPVSGVISDLLIGGLALLIQSSNPFINIISGFVLSALFLPMVLLGLHHGLIPFYATQLEQLGGVTLFPVLAMAGAGQVGAAIALYLKALRVHNTQLAKTITGALPAGFLGVGEPLIYGVTLPLGKPFITAGIGAGFGGAYVAMMNVMSTAWGPSGLTAIPLMQPASMLHFFLGLIIAYLGGFIVTGLFIKDNALKNT